jgi:hypothetical protein
LSQQPEFHSAAEDDLPLMSVVSQATLGPAEARRLTDEMKRDIQALWLKLNRLYEGGAHLALGYDSWGQYMQLEFGVGSSSQAYRLLGAGRVMDVLLPHSPNGEWPPPNEAQARELVPLLRDGEDDDVVVEVWNEVRARFGDDVTAEKVREVVAERLRSSQVGVEANGTRENGSSHSPDEALAHWVGLPEFGTNEEPIKLVISFDSRDDRAELMKQLGIETRHKHLKSQGSDVISTWWPERPKEDLSSLRFELVAE